MKTARADSLIAADADNLVLFNEGVKIDAPYPDRFEDLRGRLCGESSAGSSAVRQLQMGTGILSAYLMMLYS
jgi:hypothetical protein